ncbi:MAG TPA: histidine phosphatase family protein [Myxococcales bacterium]|nr:histidine phosphatase family protein [Myxococcales bacterium]
MGQLFLVRHGQASAFEENYDRLSSLGERQALLLGQLWAQRGIRFDRVFSGPRVRQQRTAEIAGQAGGLPVPVMLDDLDEMRVEPLFREHMPDLFVRHSHLAALGDAMLAADGNELRAQKFAQLFEAALLLWVRGEAGAPGVETWLEFRARVRQALRAVREDVAHGARIAVFTSAGPVAAAVQQAMGADDETALSMAFRVRNSSFSQFVFSGERFSLASFNETPHLHDAALVTVR